MHQFNMAPDHEVADPDSEFVQQVMGRHRQIAQLTDATDEPLKWVMALTVAAGECIARTQQPLEALDIGLASVRTHAGFKDDAIPLSETPTNQ